MYETELTVVGTLITKVDRRFTADGTPVVNFRVASNERRFDKSSSSWTNGDSLYLTVSAWRDLAENLHSSLRMGDSIIVQGRLYSRDFDVEGKRRSVVEMEASAVGPNLRWATAAVTRVKRSDSAESALGVTAVGLRDAGSGADEAGHDPWSEAMQRQSQGGSAPAEGAVSGTAVRDHEAAVGA